MTPKHTPEPREHVICRNYLPEAWIWTRRAYGQDRSLYAVRDTRWASIVPDLVAVGAESAIAQAHEIEASR